MANPQISNLSFTNFYDVVNNSEEIVKLRLVIGHAQMAVTSITKDNQKIADAVSGEDLSFDLGASKSLIRSIVQISVIVFDIVDPSENLDTSVTVTLMGGKNMFERIYTFKVENQSDIVNYSFNFFFF